MTKTDGGAAKMDMEPSGFPSTIPETMTITTYAANASTTSPLPMRNRGRVNHTVGVNIAFDNSSSIVSEPVKMCTNPSAGATGPLNITIPHANNNTETNAITIKRVGDFSSASDCSNNLKTSPDRNSDSQDSLFQFSKDQVFASPPSITSKVRSRKPSKDLLNTNVNMNTCTPQAAVASPEFVPSGKSFTTLMETCNNNNMTTPVHNRLSTASKIQRQIAKGKIEQKYDMNMVPQVRRNPDFLAKFRTALTSKSSRPVFSSMPNLVPCDTASNCDASTDSKSTSSENLPCPSSTAQDQHHQAHGNSRLTKSCPCDALFNESRNHGPTRNTSYAPTRTAPFAEDSQSCIWVPTSRSDWEDCIDELVNVCTAAAWHRDRKYNKKKVKDFSPPISHIYVKDRIDIDDPLRGYQIRHKTGGWLQGFVMMTDFTIWTHYFKWDSCHLMNGINRDNLVGVVDNGELTKELESQPRSGDPHGTGVVWPTIAEISLVGALGCGEYLLQMALEDIERRGSYEFVVLEATQTSRPFYEKFGFVRVGAVCKYGKKEDFAKEANGVEETGYRHWTYANETKARLNEHGGPSYMMAHRVKKRDSMGRVFCEACGKETPSFIDKLANYFVSRKPKIEPLGSSGNRKRSRTASAGTLSQAIGEKASKLAKTAKDATRTTSSGRQTRTPTRLEEGPDQVTLQRTKGQSNSRSSRNSTAGSAALPPKNSTPRSNTKPILRKQKIANMYRDPKKTYYYNKVVTPKQMKSTDGHNYKSRYYFVLNFEEDVKLIRLIPLYIKGTFKGKREGREKWKANILIRNDADENKWLKSMDVITAPASNWEIVDSYMVTKCSSVGEESWDIYGHKML